MMRHLFRIGMTTLLVGLIALGMTGVAVGVAQALSTPSNFVYEGRLLDSSRNAITSAVTVRFSLWKSGDWTSGDATGGSINTGASNYGGWYETQTVTPDSQGHISLRMGSSTALPDIVLTNHQYLQVEVKASGAADTSYQLMDTTGDNGADANDRQFIGSVAYAKVAETLQNKTPGTASGSLPVLQSGGVLPVSTMAAGTNADSFTLDFNNTSATEIALQFGATLAKKLIYDVTNSRFNFNDDVRIQGDLTVTGLINGIDISSLESATGTYLKALSAGGLNLSVQRGTYRINGELLTFNGTGSMTMRNNATNYVFLTSTGITLNTTGFPNDRSIVSVATVVTSAGAISSITNSLALASSDKQDVSQIALNPDFPNVSFQGDASGNVGRLYVSHDNITLKNFYLWTSTLNTLQDYDVIARVSLPPTFARWKNNAIQLQYRSTSADTANNKMDVSIYDTNGSPVTLSGSTTNLANTSWATSEIEFGGSPTWTAGQDMLIRMKVYAKDNYQMHIGSLKLNFVTGDPGDDPSDLDD